ncbi:MAG: 50S ribosomal protein L4 [Christensenellaceae bacterium]|nr:50S ribosomal protein L4 [Christensenellaceae bacterium]
MPNVSVFNIQGSKVGEIELSENIFGQEVNVPAMHAYVKAYLANQRQGTQKAKTRAEVSGGGKKPWRQKGTGRARQGSTRSPQWTHGGVVFAPRPRDYRQSLNKKLKRVALKSALSSKVANEKLLVLDSLVLEAAKTKEMVKVLGNLKVKNALIVMPEVDETVVRASNNIPGVASTIVGSLNTYDILKHDTVILTKDSVEKVEEVYA